jgi:hypothetical protein
VDEGAENMSPREFFDLATILKLVGVFLLGAGFIIGQVDSMREFKRQQALFHQRMTR